MRIRTPFLVLRCLLLAAGIGAASIASAVPIAYEGTLLPGVTRIGAIGDPSLTGTPNDDFWNFSGIQGQQIFLIGNRLDSGLDLSMILYSGVGTNTNQLLQIAAADDNYPELPGLAGPFADPRIPFTPGFFNDNATFMLPTTGMYTVQMWDLLSTAVPPGTQRCYQVTLNGEPTAPLGNCAGTVPEPGSLSLFGIALAGLLGAMGRGVARSRRAAH